jgi:uncharacterized protein YijF (DUF1287 family)
MKRPLALWPLLFLLVFLGLGGLSGLLIGCSKSEPPVERNTMTDSTHPQSHQKTETTKMDTPTSPIVAAARNQIGKTTTYDPSYVCLDYPGGDVAIERGVCTDVVIRALRDAMNMDLQKLIHEDMTSAFSEYPKKWGLTKPDRNIDHRRVPNLRCYFERKNYSLPVTEQKEDYFQGDFVTCTVPPNRPHIMIVSNKISKDGVPLVIHNIGAGTREENRLFSFPITGHYRIE